jgi:hypothetical protein
MATFIDHYSSMNAGEPINVAVGVPTLFGVIGLRTQGIAGNGGMPGGLIVDLSGNISFIGDEGSAVEISVLRGTTLGSPTILRQIVTFAGGDETKTVAFNAQDLNAPAALQTAYSAFVSLITGVATRVGPETFWGIASRS